MDLTRNSFLEINVNVSLIKATRQKVFKQQQGTSKRAVMTL